MSRRENDRRSAAALGSGALLNFGISLAGRVPVNLNYTASKQSMEVAVERCGLKTIFTSEKLLSRLGIEKQPGMVMMEDVAKDLHQAATNWFGPPSPALFPPRCCGAG